MTVNEFDVLMKHIKSIYSSFEVDEDEWFRILQKYSYKDVKDKVDARISSTPPTWNTLIKGLKEEVVDSGAWMKCEYCKKMELVFDTDDWIKAHRRCQQIDFIDRQSKQIMGKGITKTLYYEMGENEFEENYRKVMNYYLEHKEPLVIKSL